MRPPFRSRSASAALGLLLVLCTATARAQEPPADVEFTRDIVYGKGGGEDLMLNLSRPKGDAKNLPCVVVIHGGWAQGHLNAHNDITWHLAKKGYVAATVGYRLAPKHRFPSQVEDVKCAVRFLRAHADKFGLDPHRIGAVGFSAGAHLSMMLGTMGPEDGLEGEGGWPDQPSKVQAVFVFFGPTDLAADDIPEVTRPIIREFIGGTPAEKADEYRKASPIHYLSEGDAPMLLFQGTNDPLVPHSQAIRMAEAMAKAGAAGRVEIMLGAGHGWGGEELRRTGGASLEFFGKHLRP